MKQLVWIYLMISSVAIAVDVEEYRDMVRHTPLITKDGVIHDTIEDFGTYHALLIYVEEYTNTDTFPNLDTPKNDIDELSTILRDRYGFSNITKVKNPKTSDDLLKAFDDLSKTLKDNDNILIYYAGHGSFLAKDGTWNSKDSSTSRKGYWNLANAVGDGRSGSISLEEAVKDSLLRIKSRHVLVISDSCYSGYLNRGVVNEESFISKSDKIYYSGVYERTSRTVLTSGGLVPVLDHDIMNRRHSIFAVSFLNMLKHNNNPIFALNEKYKEICQYVSNNTGNQQIPEYEGLKDSGQEPNGDFIFLDYKSIYAHKDNPIKDTIQVQNTITYNPAQNTMKPSSIEKYMLWALGIIAVLLLIIVILYLRTRKQIRRGDVIVVPSETEEKETETIKQQIKGAFEMNHLLYENHSFVKQYSWEEAKDYAKSLRIGDFDDWRLPTRDELRALGNITLYGAYDVFWEEWYEKHKDSAVSNSKGEKHFIREAFLENMPKDSWFWTLESKDEDDIWRVGFHLGCSDVCYDEDMSYVLCVREQKKGEE